MRVDTALALRVLAHELRSPTGVAQGYVRMLLEHRLEAEADRQRALEQIRETLGRLGQLSRQASDAATWLERLERPADASVDARALLERAIDRAQQAHEIRRVFRDTAARLATPDREALEVALATLLEATGRETPGEALEVRMQAADGHIELLAGGAARLDLLAAGPDAPEATAIVVERGGLGLTLVTAALVLEAHGATTWTIDGARDLCGIRLPIAA